VVFILLEVKKGLTEGDELKLSNNGSNFCLSSSAQSEERKSITEKLTGLSCGLWKDFLLIEQATA
jgi:hypothetical protein